MSVPLPIVNQFLPKCALEQPLQQQMREESVMSAPHFRCSQVIQVFEDTPKEELGMDYTHILRVPRGPRARHPRCARDSV